MARITNNNISPSAASAIDDLCCQIYRGDCVLVIGDDAVLNTAFEPSGSNKAYLDRELDKYEIELYGKTQKDVRVRKQHMSEMLSTGWAYDIDAEVNPDLVKLLATKCFRVVITTTFDGYLEAAMRHVWGDELRVLDIYGGIRSFDTYSEFDIVPPTLIYAFGKAQRLSSKFVYTEDDAIELFAKRWFDSTKRPKSLLDYICSGEDGKRIICIGCKLDDWEFRIFWYSLRQDLSKLGNGDVAISLNHSESEIDRKLHRYLTDKAVGDKGNARAFLATLQRELNDPEKYVYERLKNNMQQGGVFISYASEDFNLACLVHKKLMQAGCKVWLDNSELIGGNEFNYRISKAISECRVFMPLLTAQTAADLTAGNTGRYYMNEWQQAAPDSKDKPYKSDQPDKSDKQDKQDKQETHAYVPVVFPGFDFKFMRGLLPTHLQNRTVVEWTAPDGPENLVVAVNINM